MKVVIFTDVPTNGELKAIARRESVSDVDIVTESTVHIATRTLRQQIAATPPVEDDGFGLALLFFSQQGAKP